MMDGQLRKMPSGIRSALNHKILNQAARPEKTFSEESDMSEPYLTRNAATSKGVELSGIFDLNG
jgi:hypothetical protein